MQVAHENKLVDKYPIKDLIEDSTRVLNLVRNFAAIFHNGKLTYVNPAARKMLACDKSCELVGKGLSSLLHASYQEISAIPFSHLVDEDQLLVKFESGNCGVIDVHLWISHMDYISDDTFLLEAREITKHLQSAAELQVREQRLQGVLNTVPDCIVTLDKDRRILTANPAAAAEFHMPIAELLDRDIGELVPHLADVNLTDFLDSSWERAYQGDKYWFGLREGESFPVELVVRAMREKQDTNYTCIIRNIEERVRAEQDLQRYLVDLEHNQKILEGQASEAVYLAEELELQKRASERMALHDPLTDLPNRRYFQDFLEESLATAKSERASVCLLFIDLDRFKEVNDTLGHDAGDDLLLEVAANLLKNTRNRDMVARLGGDEFAVILNSRHMVGVKTYWQIAERILEDLNIAVPAAEGKIQTSASIGAAMYPKDVATLDNLVKKADERMYLAKKGGRNQIVFNDL